MGLDDDAVRPGGRSGPRLHQVAEGTGPRVDPLGQEATCSTCA